MSSLVAVGLASLFTIGSQASYHDITKSVAIRGNFCHGANYQYGECLSNWDNPNLELTDAGLAFWQAFCLKHLTLLSENEIEEGLDEENEYVTSSLTDDMAQLFGGRDFWETVLSEDEEGINPILDNPSIYLAANEDGSSNRGFLPGASEILNGDYSKYSSYRGYHIENQGMYTLSQWNEADGIVKLKCFDDGSGNIKIIARNLVPYLPYTIWGLYGMSNYTGNANDTTATGPMAAHQVGGVPSAFYANKYGHANVGYDVPFCPLDSQDPLMWIALLAHWDFVVPGANPRGDRPISIIGADHLCFSVGDYI